MLTPAKKKSVVKALVLDAKVTCLDFLQNMIHLKHLKHTVA